MNMLEKVAQAVCLAQWGGYPLERKEREAWPQWAEALKVARAAIEAMREPTKEMMTAGASMHWDDYRYRDESTRDQWEAMISAALKEQEKVG